MTETEYRILRPRIRENKILMGSEKDIICEALENYAKERWIPIEEKFPENDKYILVSFENFSLPDIARYEENQDGGGTFYPGDEEKSYIDLGLFVNAWRELPDPYRESEL